MKMKLIAVLFAVLMLSVLIPQSVCFAGNRRPFDPNSGNNVMTGVTGTVDEVWGSVLLIVQVVSVACVVLAGVRYMFASADKKADIKKGLLYLVIGATFVFAASTLIKFIFNIGNSAIT
ncbi:MAG: TrbC/VirB2 family protein [Clostridia bacterium]|nr:TrbC/VirB2 family protein [Clostridia bacterium]